MSEQEFKELCTCFMTWDTDTYKYMVLTLSGKVTFSDYWNPDGSRYWNKNAFIDLARSRNAYITKVGVI